MTLSEYERWTDVSDRDAIGELLSEAERAFLTNFAETDPLARAEHEMWHSLATLEPSGDELRNRAVADAAVRRVTAAAQGARRASRPWAVLAAGGALAAAAAAALLVVRHPAPEPQATGESVVEFVASGARAMGNPVALGARVPGGTEIEAVGGPVCVAVQPRIHACLASGAKLRLSQISAAERRVDLVQGRVAVALFPLPKGQRFSVVAGNVWSTAVGTAFTVELEPGGSVETIVHEGKVAVGKERGADVVGAHKIGLSADGRVSIAPLESHERTETPEWAALASVAQRSIEALPLPTPAVAAATIEAPMASTGEVAAPTALPAPRNKAVVGVAAVATQTNPPEAVALPSASELLSSARQALRERRWNDAANIYREIVSSLPASPEAHTVLVPLARVEVEQLGQPDAALRDLDAYLVAGGPLDVEARLAKIHVYRVLGRTTDEAKAIDEFLSAHPNSLESSALRERKAILGATQ